MSSLLYYLLQVIVSSGILYLYYIAFLRNKRFHQYNRFYLLGTIVLSIVIPFLQIPVYFTHEQTQDSIVVRTLTTLSFSNEGVINADTDQSSSGIMIYSINLIYCFYALIAGIALVRILYGLLRIKRLSDRYPIEKLGNINFVSTNDSQAPFSFFNWLFWNRGIELNSEKGEQVFRHELFHIRQRHSLDIVFLELVSMIFWINPFFHLIKKETRAIHEFLADQYALDQGERWNYAETLLMHALQTKNSLVNPFFHNQIKRRLAMIMKPHKTSHQYLRKILVLPVATIVIALFAFSYQKDRTLPTTQKENISGVVIDALNIRDSMPGGYNIVSLDIKFADDFSLKGENINMHIPEGSLKKDSKFGLIILNGEFLTFDQAKKKLNGVIIKSADISIIPAEDQNAITKYGDRARSGVMVIKNAVVVQRNLTQLTEKPITRVSPGKEKTHEGKLVIKGVNTEPLIIVDGEELPPSPEGDETTNRLKYLDPNIIESINVLKDESATSIYGEKGKNGVILIKTKKKTGVRIETDRKDTAVLTVIGYKQKPLNAETGKDTQ